MKTILTIVMGVFIAQTLTAQNDSLVIKLDDYGQLLIVSSNFVTKKSNSLELDSLYKDFYTNFKNVNIDTANQDNYVIEFRQNAYHRKNSTINIIKIEPESDKYYFNDNKFGSIKSFRFKIALSSRIFLFLNSLKDLEKVSNISLDGIYTQFKNNIQAEDLNKRKPYLFFYESKKNTLDNDTKFIYPPGNAQDYISLYSSFGAQIINSSIAPQIDIIADVAINWKNSPGQKFGIGTTFLFMPDKDDIYNINTYNFVNISYYLKFDKKWIHKLSVGYLFDKNGDDFSENTWNAFWSSKLNKVGVKIGGYYTKNNDGNYVVIPSFGFSLGF